MTKKIDYEKLIIACIAAQLAAGIMRIVTPEIKAIIRKSARKGYKNVRN